MLLADSVILIVGGLLIVGILGFFTAAVVVVARFMGFVYRAIAGGPSSQTRAELHCVGNDVACPAPRCGNMNPSGARYCARCGRPLGRHDDVDAYG